MDRRTLLSGLAIMPLTLPMAARAAQIGENVPFPPLSAARIQALPAQERAAWKTYFQRSEAQMAADKAALRAERTGLKEIPADPDDGNGQNTMPLDKPTEWYGTDEAKLITANILSFQTPAGGWGKNQPRNAPPRARGQAYVIGEEPKRPVGDFDIPTDPKWHYVGTTDNGATIHEIRFLARVIGSTGDAAAKASAIKGLTYFLNAQFPNGGWPQVWPLEGGYHDALTLNDNAMISVTALIGEAGRGQGDYAFVPADLRVRLLAAERAAIAVFMALQVKVDGKPMLWAPQYDALTLTPCSARNFEMPSLSSTDSGALLIYLMTYPDPTPQMKAAIRSGVAALKSLAIEGKDFTYVEAIDARRLIDKPDALPIWGRYLDLKTLQPIFGARSKAIYDSVADVELGGRKGYAWFSRNPQRALNAFDQWRLKHP
ncbi:pectate lyase [Asticcacaulis machinosus]|uniref:Pectate lyase n=1 Tax=Asticcacaulis machinosus TaxID=2984211 RepID=A0ABT5HHT8_9CAUL|nr:pectate lyase [Asticcacaulis machinosus]MDC7675801.1 pectate lyase [Asticcacaulis machinosus]